MRGSINTTSLLERERTIVTSRTIAYYIYLIVLLLKGFLILAEICLGE